MNRKATLLLLLLVLCFSKKSLAQCPPNIDFEYGNFTNWLCYTGLFGSGYTYLAATPSLSGPVANRHTIMTGAGTDMYGGFPIVDPGGGTYAARLGYNVTGQLAERIRYYVRIPAGSATFDLVYKYAVVLENPGHLPSQQPWFDVAATDSATGLALPCSSYSYVSSSSLPGFALSTIGADVYWRGWNTATLNLSGLGGTTIAIDFAAGDCSLGAHFGYAYVDMSCGFFAVQGLTCNDTATHLALSAPSGYEYYTWYDSANYTIRYGDSQSIIIPIPDSEVIVAVVLTPYVGFGCPDTLYTRIAPSHLALHPHDTLICSGDSVTLNAHATDVALPLTYVWTGANLLCNTCATPVAFPAIGTYSVTVTNVNNCTKDTTITVRVDDFAATFSSSDDTCHQGTTGWAKATVTAGVGPYSYIWSNGATTALASGLSGDGTPGYITYSVTVSDALGCSLKDAIPIHDGNPTDLYLVTATHPDICGAANGWIKLDSLTQGDTFAVSYLYHGVLNTQTLIGGGEDTVRLIGLDSGAYTNISAVKLSVDKYHCPYNVISGPVVLPDPPQPALPAIATNSPVCNGAALTINAISSTGVIYTWSGPGGFSSADSNIAVMPSNFSDSGVYSVFVMGVLDSCYSYISSVRAVINPVPAPFAPNVTVCSGNTLNLTSSSIPAATTFIWNGPNGFYANAQNPAITNVQTTASGIYTVTAVLNGCDNTTTTTVLVNQTPGPPIVTDTEICQHSVAGPMIATGDSTDVINWYANATGGTSTSIVPVPSTANSGTVTYYVSQTTPPPADCESPRVPITTQIDYLASPSLEISDTVLCLQGDIQFTAANTGSDMTGIEWSFGDGINHVTTNPVTHSFTGTGVFTVTATALYKVCPEETISRTVRIFAALNINIGKDTSICPGGQAIVLSDNANAAIPGVSWKWSTGETSSQIQVTTPGTYYVVVAADGCSASDTVTVLNNCYLDIPNVFTPNGDGLNDYFLPRQLLAKGLTSFSMEIYNRWGQQVFSTTTLDGRGWDGRFNDMPQPEGVYVYVIDATFIDGQKEHHQGNITLLR